MRPALLPARFSFHPQPEFKWIPTSIPQFNEKIGGLPCGTITEICGDPSSGRTSLLAAILAEVARRSEACAIVDASDTFDVTGAQHLIWVRCSGNAAHALKAADLLVQGGGFRLVVLDLADVPLRILRRIPLSYWFRFRRAVEHTPTAMLVLSREPQVRQCASLVIEMKRSRVDWSGSPAGFQLLRGTRLEAIPRKPALPVAASFETRAWG